MDQSQFSPLIKARATLEAWGVRIVSLLTAAMGVVNLFSAIIPAVHAHKLIIRDIIPMEVLHGTRLAVALAGIALFLLSSSLWRPKQIAWLLRFHLDSNFLWNYLKNYPAENKQKMGVASAKRLPLPFFEILY